MLGSSNHIIMHALRIHIPEQITKDYKTILNFQKELFNEQMSVFKEKQREEIALLERELQKTRDKMEESKKEYETYIRQLTKELWSVGEKYLVKNDEAEWLRKKQKSGSLMSLQHVHSVSYFSFIPSVHFIKLSKASHR